VKTNGTWSSFAVCLALALLVSSISAVSLRYRAIGQKEAASRHRLELLPHGPVVHPAANHDLLFDPVLVYSSFLGGPSSSLGVSPGHAQFANVIYVDSSGNLYLAGGTNSASFPTTPGVVGPTQGQSSGFLAKVDPTGQHLVFSTYVPGFIAPVSGMTVDAAGDIYVAGGSNPADAPALPIPPGSMPFRTDGSIGILKLNPTATTVLAATYIGGSAGDTVGGIALDSSDNLYITGTTISNDFPTQSALQPSLGTSGNNVYVTVLNSSLSTAVYSTYLGQNSSAGTGIGHSIAVDASKNAYVTGFAGAGFPVTSGTAAQASCSGNCVFVAKLNASGLAISYATYLGSQARGGAIGVDASQNIFVTGSVISGGFNELNPVSTFPSCNANLNAGENFVSEINASGALAFSTCPGGGAGSITSVGSLALDSSGNVYVAGLGFAALPLKNPIQSNSGDGEPYVVGINPSASSVVFASFLGGAQAGETDFINDIAIDSTGNIYAAGFGQPYTTPPTVYPPFPVFNALQPGPSGNASCPTMNPCGPGNDAIFLKVAPTDAPAAAVAPAILTFPAQAIGAASAPLPLTIFDLGSTALTVSNVSVTGDFSIQESCTTVTAAGGSCPVQVTFTPTAPGTRTGTMTITDNSAGSPRTVALTGIGGQAAVTLSPTSLSVSGAVNTKTTSPVTLNNSGTLPLQISTVQVSGATFSETNNCGVSVPSGQSCVINVMFSPTAAGNSTGTLTITDSGAGSPHTVALTGTGVADSIGLVYPPNTGPSSANVQAGTVAITNIQVGGAGVGGTVSLSCSGLPQGAACSFDPSSTVQVSPTASRSVQLTITTTARSLLFGPIVLTTGLMVLAIWVSFVFLRNASTSSTPRLRWRFVPLFALAICACGGNGSSPSGGSNSSTGTPAGSHIVTITATSGSATETLLFNLIVE